MFLKAISFLSALLVSSAVLAGVAWVAPEALFAYLAVAGGALLWLALSSEAGDHAEQAQVDAEQRPAAEQQAPVFGRRLSVVE